MGKAMEIIQGQVTAPTGATVPLVMAADNTLVVRNAVEASKNYLLNIWARFQAVGVVRVMSPMMHDRINGIRVSVNIADEDPLMPWGCPQPVLKGDTLLADLNTVSVGAVIEIVNMILYYDDLIGADQKLIDVATLKGRIKNILTMRNTCAAGAAGGWSGAQLLNAIDDRFIADREYAILGYMTTVPCAAVRYIGPDTSNLGVGGHGCNARRYETVHWFKNLSERYGLPLIPVINSNNKANTFIEVAQDNGAAAVTIDTIYAELTKA